MEVDTAEFVLAYDIGGSHVSAGLCRLDTLSIDQIATAPLVEKYSSEEFLDLLQGLGDKLVGCSGGSLASVAGAALAFPGPFDYSAGISHMRHKFESLFGVDLKSGLASRFGWEPEKIRFQNDADAALLGEVGAGAAVGAERAVGIWLGTGIGSAFAVHGQVVTEGKGVPPGGEVWNLPFRDGTVEDLLSTRALQGNYAAKTGKHQSVASIAAGSAADADARAVFETFGQHLGQFIEEVLSPFAPDLVVLGGGISGSSALFLPAAKAEIGSKFLKVATSKLLEKAPLVGGAVFWRNESLHAASSMSSQAETV